MFDEFVVYINPDCNPCKMLKSWLDKQGITYVEKDIINDKRAAREFMSMGINFTPFSQITVKGVKYDVVGADVMKITDILRFSDGGTDEY
ncbi:glutaredoxin family protein [Bacillus sp. S17B2]|uniref:glutaredoxin family protein n=1 Tax=Bacillus sp. S17B2 TaxID=2918907 RepID=UPI00227EACE7|nr:glutaredoxin family protein [Bacillus sp. S17B2]